MAQQPYSLHPYQSFRWQTDYANHPYTYAVNNPVNYTDPSGLCVPYVEVGCVPFWETDEGLNWDDAADYVQTAVVDPLTGFVKPTWDVITDAPGARDTVRQGLSQLGSHPIDSAGVIVKGFAAPFDDMYHGIVNRDPDQVGRGLTGFVMLLGGARLARNPSIGLRNPLGGRITVGGQVVMDCVKSAQIVASMKSLPVSPAGSLGRFIGRPGAFNPMWKRFGRTDVPAHLAVKSINGTIIDRTIFKNIKDYGPVPTKLARYQRFDTFTPRVYNQLLDAFYDAWTTKQIPSRPPTPGELMDWGSGQ